MRTIAIIVAGGSGKRMGQPKQFLEIGGQPMLARTLAVFDQCRVIDEIILVVAPDDLAQAQKLKARKLKRIVTGGAERQDSVFNGLKALPPEAELVVIHDGARPFVTIEIIERAVAKCLETGAVVVGLPIKDTIKHVDSGQLTVNRTMDRSQLWAAQTPQVFRKDLIVEAYSDLANAGKVTDDAMLVEKIGIQVTMVLGSEQNIKITTPEDLVLAKGVVDGKSN